MTRTPAALFFVATLLLAGAPGAPGSREDSEGEVRIAGSGILAKGALTPSSLAALQAPSLAGALHPRCQDSTARNAIQTNAVATILLA